MSLPTQSTSIWPPTLRRSCPSGLAHLNDFQTTSKRLNEFDVEECRNTLASWFDEVHFYFKIATVDGMSWLWCKMLYNETRQGLGPNGSLLGAPSYMKSSSRRGCCITCEKQGSVKVWNFENEFCQEFQKINGADDKFGTKRNLLIWYAFTELPLRPLSLH